MTDDIRVLKGWTKDEQEELEISKKNGFTNQRTSQI